jgi:hypothetical protein
MSGFTEDKTRALCICFRNTTDVPPVVRFCPNTDKHIFQLLYGSCNQSD